MKIFMSRKDAILGRNKAGRHGCCYSCGAGLAVSTSPARSNQDRSMRVLHVITALGVGGAERMLLKLLGARALSGCEQQVVAMLPGGALAAAMRATGAQVHELDFLGGFPLVGGALGLVQIARRCNPDIVQGWMYHGNLGASLARASLPRRVPLVWGIRQSLATLAGENAFARIGIALNRVGSGRPDRLLFNSRISLTQHRDFGFQTASAQYLPNGFETSAFAPDTAARARWRAVWAAQEDTVLFGLSARYHPIKDHANFLQAAGRAVAARPDIRIVLAGPDIEPANEALMRAVRDANLTGHVQLLGEQSDMAAVLAGLDVYVSSSAGEAFSNAIGEAMSCGLPCVVTDVGDSAAIVGDTGRVVPPRDPAALAAAMLEMVDLGAIGRAALGVRARQRVVAEFDLEAVAARYAELYGELIHATALAS
jgi:glycosyltransferase involved in cell wall biosynthesis